MNAKHNTSTGQKAAYRKPAIIHRERMEVLAIVCDSAWVPQRTCKLQGEVGCVKTRL